MAAEGGAIGDATGAAGRRVPLKVLLVIVKYAEPDMSPLLTTPPPLPTVAELPLTVLLLIESDAQPGALPKSAAPLAMPPPLPAELPLTVLLLIESDALPG